ncbi:MAG: SGNH/GDSL hydrolase family protein [bacterium]
MKEKIRNIILFTLLLAALFAAGEAAVRIFLPQIGRRPLADIDLGWSTKEYREFDPLKDGRKARKRILFLGDSNLAGDGVSRPGQRFPMVLKKKLGEGADARILAAGGWGTDQEFLAFLQKGTAWKPGLAVLAFCANNDLANNLSNRHDLHMHKPYFVLEDGGELKVHDPYGKPMEIAFRQQKKRRLPDSYLVDLIRYAVKYAALRPEKEEKRDFSNVDPRYRTFDLWAEKHDEIRALKPSLSWSPQLGGNHVSAYIHEDFELNAYQWKLTEAILAAFRNESEKAGINFVVMLLPVSLKAGDLRFVAGGGLEFRFQTPDGPFTFRAAEPRDRLRAICARNGINFFDPTADFIEAVRKNRLEEAVWPCRDFCHLSPVGHEMLAELLLGYLKENPGLL